MTNPCSVQTLVESKTTEGLNKQPVAPLVETVVALLTGGIDRPYVFGLSRALASRGVSMDVIGSDELDGPEMHVTPGLNFLNLRGDQTESASFAKKSLRVLTYYARLLSYAPTAKPKIFHILWNNRFLFFDRTLLMLYYKLMGKKIAFTAHNVNAARRDSTDSLINRLTLKIQYHLCDHIFVHTEKMKDELVRDFRVGEQSVTVVPFGINNAVPHTALTIQQAKQRLNIEEGTKTVLFFGRIGPYKGLELLVSAFQRIAKTNPQYRLLIVGKPKKGAEEYLNAIQKTICEDIPAGRVIQKIDFIPDEDTELYFKAADVLVLPYTRAFQSGVLFLGYSFGLPVIASDVACFGDDIVEGRTGFLFQPGDAAGLATTIENYFQSDLFRSLSDYRPRIVDYALSRHSWDKVSEITTDVYSAFLTTSQDMRAVQP